MPSPMRPGGRRGPTAAADTLARMLKRGTISPPMRQAADDFRALFHRALA